MTYLQKIKNLKDYLESYREQLRKEFKENNTDKVTSSSCIGGMFVSSLVLKYFEQIAEGEEGDLKRAIKEAAKLNEQFLNDFYKEASVLDKKLN